MAASGKDWASAYVLDPLNAPAPADEMGPGGSIGQVTQQPPAYSPVAQQGTGDSNNPYRRSSLTKNGASTHTRQISTGSAGRAVPLSSGKSPITSEFPRVSGEYLRPSAAYLDPEASTGRTRRKSSLTARYPGDPSVRPLDMLKHDNKAANRAPHLQKRHLPGADTIDRLDDVGFRYHHEGPYDAALLSRNTDTRFSPVAALARSNEEALKATPSEKIYDAVRGHKPLDGTAIVPPGEADEQGRVYQYQEGTDMMRQDGGTTGNYRRWDGEVDYRDDDLEGRGEPAFSLGEDLRNHRRKSSVSPEGQGAIELVERPKRDTRDPVEIAGGQREYSELEQERRNSGEASGVHRHHSIAGALKSRIGSLRKRKD